MATANLGDSVVVHFTGKLSNGEVFATSEGKDPIRFELGAGKLLPGLEQSVVGMNTGDSKTVTLAAKEAYGERRDDQVVEVDRKQMQTEAALEVGQTLRLATNDGQEVQVKVAELTDSKVKLDANHPLAGQDLTFDLTLVDVPA